MSFSTLNAANHRNLNLLVGDTGTIPPFVGWIVLDDVGASFAVPLTVKDSTDTNFTVPSNVLDSAGASFTPI